MKNTKTIIEVAIIGILAASLLGADLTTYDKSVHLGNEVHSKPQALPNGTTSIVSQDVFITALAVMVSPTAAATTVTIQDKQNGIVLFSAGQTASNPLSTGLTYIVVPAGFRYWSPGGFSVTTNGTGISIYGSWEQRGTPSVTQ